MHRCTNASIKGLPSRTKIVKNHPRPSRHALAALNTVNENITVSYSESVIQAIAIPGREIEHTVSCRQYIDLRNALYNEPS